MFRIKTDIRQYKCETKDKVEKLIRNWVIRPNDLIYDQDENTWEPIGDHPSFVNVFTMLAETEATTPDTVVSKKPKKEGEEEVTNVAERPEFDDSEVSEGEDSRATDIFDHEEIIRTLPDDKKETPKPPEAPEGVEPPRQDDEVTMMTDKTFDMLAEEAISEVADDSEAVEESTDEEPEDDEDTGVKEKPQKPNGVQTDLSLADAESDPTIVETQEKPAEEESEGDTPVDAPKLGRHDLPEEFFATNEITTVNREDVEKRDDLNETASEASEVDEEWEQLVDDFRAVEELASEASEAADPNESPALRDTDELDRPPEPTLQEDLDEISDSFDEPDEDPDAEDSEAEEEEPAEHIDGYLIPAPFNVGPTADDMKLGLKRTKMSQARKLAAFPDPKQKEYKDPIIRHFDRTPPIPKDYTVLMVFGCIFLFGFVLFLISQC